MATKPEATDIYSFLEGYGIDASVISDSWIDDIRDNHIIPAINQITRLDFESTQSVTEYYSGNGKQLLILNRRPIVSLDAIEYVVGGNTEYLLNVAAIEVIAEQGILKSKANYDESFYQPVFAKGERNIKITYTYGYSTMPNDIRQAIIYLTSEQVLENIADRTGGGNLSVQGFSRDHGAMGRYHNLRVKLAARAHFILKKYSTGVVG